VIVVLIFLTHLLAAEVFARACFYLLPLLEKKRLLFMACLLEPIVVVKAMRRFTQLPSSALDMWVYPVRGVLQPAS